MKKLFCMIALAAISFGVVSAAIPVKASQDTTKMKMKKKNGKMKMKKKKTDTTKMQYLHKKTPALWVFFCFELKPHNCETDPFL